MAAGKILIVEDDREVRRVLCTAINWFGYSTVEADDGIAAFDLYVKYGADLVITDIYMPRMNGPHLLRALRRYDPNAKVVLITGGSNYWKQVGDEANKPDGFLQKPFDITDLMDICRTLMVQKIESTKEVELTKAATRPYVKTQIE